MASPILEFMGKDWDAPWQAGIGIGEHNAGFHDVDLADGAKRLPRPVFMGSTNPTCRNCGGLRNGREGKKGQQPCRCGAPRFDNTTLPRMHAFQAWCEAWAGECLRVLKPGGWLLAFGGTRTWHRLCCGIEDAGFEIRDSIDWLYGSGFPKNPACLKPAHEPIIMARKPSGNSAPLPGLDGCRVDPGSHVPGGGGLVGGAASRHEGWRRDAHLTGEPSSPHDAGRWPPNVVLGPAAAAELDRQSGVLHSHGGGHRTGQRANGSGWGMGEQPDIVPPASNGGASRFFPVFRYEAKAPASERPRAEDGTAHPTVKPVDLMRWLVRLVTPSDGLVLDPFAGSGTTAEACIVEGFRCILAEKDPASAGLIVRRLRKPIQPVMFGDVS